MKQNDKTIPDIKQYYYLSDVFQQFQDFKIVIRNFFDKRGINNQDIDARIDKMLSFQQFRNILIEDRYNRKNNESEDYIDFDIVHDICGETSLNPMTIINILKYRR